MHARAWQKENGAVQNFSQKRVLEIAVSTALSLRAALEGGADRIELCSALALGGLTPDQALLEYGVAQCQALNIPLVVMIRPRAGGFVYDAAELPVMLRSIALARQAGVSGLVSGALLPGGRIDPVAAQQLVDASGDLPFTFHRAFDQSPEPMEDLELLAKAGVRRILTGGGPGSASEPGLRSLAETNRGRLALIAAGGIRPATLPSILAIPGIFEFHSAATSTVAACSGATDIPAYPNDPIADTETVRALKAILN